MAINLGSTFQEVIDEINSIKNGTNGSGGSSSTGGNFLTANTHEEMGALIVDDNIGKIVMFLGETTDRYQKGRMYLIEESLSALDSFVLDASVLE